jgi:7-cyano-7-deazaguanine synthase
MKAILLSGGLDSAALAFMCKPALAINIDYGQLAAKAERAASTAIADSLGIPLQLIDINCSSLGSGDLVATQAHTIAPVSEWWPYRNQLLITLAAMRAVIFGAEQLLIGTVKTDETHKDGTAEFIEAMDNLLNLQEGGMRLSAPARGLTTLELISESKVPDSLLAWTHSCHTGNYPCGTCNGCNKHFFIKEKLAMI